MSDLDVELLGELTVHRLNNLAGTVDQAADQLLHKHRHLAEGVMLLVAARQCYEVDVVMAAQLLGQVSVNVAFVSHSIQMGVPTQQGGSCFLVGHVGPNQLEVQDSPTQCDEQMQFVAEDGLLLGANSPKSRSTSEPIASSG